MTIQIESLFEERFRGLVVIAPEVPLVGTVVSSVEESIGNENCVLFTSRLDFALVNRILDSQTIGAVIVPEEDFADHARKMLQEAGIGLVVHADAEAIGNGAGRCLIDSSGLTFVEQGVPISAICSVMNDRNLRSYQRYGITSLGYFRFKFCLFQLFSEDRSAYYNPARIEEFLFERLVAVGQQHWTSIRCVLSDPTTAELAEMGVDVSSEINPDMGLRGPRVMDRWVSELNAIRRFQEQSDLAVEICAPFVSTVEEYRDFVSLVDKAGIDLERVGLGFTLEVPAIADCLDGLFGSSRVDFMGIGTSDLFALYNGVDRNNSALKVAPNSPANVRLLRRIVDQAAAHGVRMFVCGDVRRDETLMTELIRAGVTELISSARAEELMSVTRLSSSR